MAKRPPSRATVPISEIRWASLPASLTLRWFFYITALIQAMADRPGNVGPALMCTAALLVFSLIQRWVQSEEENSVLILAGIESVLVAFVVYFAGVGSGIILLPVALTALLSVERGQQAGIVFAWVNCVAWLTPTIVDKSLGQLNTLGLLYRVTVICVVPFVIQVLPRERAPFQPLERQQSRALEQAQEKARQMVQVSAVQEQELYQERRKLEALMHIAQRLAVLRNPDELLSAIVACAKEQLQVSTAVVFLRKGQQLMVEWTDGISEAGAACLSGAVGQGLLGRLVVSGESFLYSQVDGVEAFRPYWPLQGLEHLLPPFRRQALSAYLPGSDDLKNFVVVPLKTPAESAPLGLLMVANRLVGERFSLHDMGYLQILATDAAISIRNLFLLAERERSHDEMIRALAQAIEAKDPYTSGHVTRVCTYSTRLAQAMGLSQQFIRDLNTAAMLHDVGKISTPDSILMKQGPLTDEEFEVMKEHVVHSARIIRDIRSLSPEIPKMVLGHHERWDGKGYPHGLKGEQIPMGAQIMAVADAYDAMTSHRPYRNGLDNQEALRRLEKGAGSQFNVSVVAYFMAMFDYQPKDSPTLAQLVNEVREKVGANLLRTSSPRTGEPGSGPSGLEEVELPRDESRETSR